MAEKKKYNSILISGRKDQTLTYSKYVKDEESGESVKESLDKKVNVTDELTTQQIKDGAITNEKMAAGSVGNTNLQDGSVSNEKLEDGSITNEKLAENSITKDKLKDNTIGVEKLDPELRQTINAATGLPENLVETIQNVDDTLRDHQSQLDDKQSQIDDKQQQITANDEDISLLQTRSTQMEETIKSIAATGGASQATAVTYNNEKSGLTAVNAQAAIDETNTKLSDLSYNIIEELGTNSKSYDHTQQNTNSETVSVEIPKNAVIEYKFNTTNGASLTFIDAQGNTYFEGNIHDTEFHSTTARNNYVRVTIFAPVGTNTRINVNSSGIKGDIENLTNHSEFTKNSVTALIEELGTNSKSYDHTHQNPNAEVIRVDIPKNSTIKYKFDTTKGASLTFIDAQGNTYFEGNIFDTEYHVTIANANYVKVSIFAPANTNTRINVNSSGIKGDIENLTNYSELTQNSVTALIEELGANSKSYDHTHQNPNAEVISVNIPKNSTIKYKFDTTKGASLTFIDAQGNTYFEGNIFDTEYHATIANANYVKVSIFAPANTNTHIDVMPYGVKGDIENLSLWKNKKILCIGDSLTNNGGWTDIVKEKLGLSALFNRGISASTLTINTDDWEYNIYIDNTKLTQEPSPISNFNWVNKSYHPNENDVLIKDTSFNSEDRYNYMIKPLSDIDIDAVIIWGGHNDAGFKANVINLDETITDYSNIKKEITPDSSLENIDNAIAALIIKVSKLWNKAKIIIIGTPFSVEDANNNTKSRISLEINERLKKIASLYGCSFLDIRANGFINILNYSMFTDGVHPNDVGKKMYASTVIGFLQNHPCI